MEVYENILDAQRFETLLNDLLAGKRYSGFLAPGSARHIERFVAQAR